MQSLSLRAVRAHETDPSLSHRGVFPDRTEQQQHGVELRSYPAGTTMEQWGEQLTLNMFV